MDYRELVPLMPGVGLGVSPAAGKAADLVILRTLVGTLDAGLQESTTADLKVVEGISSEALSAVRRWEVTPAGVQVGYGWRPGVPLPLVIARALEVGQPPSLSLWARMLLDGVDGLAALHRRTDVYGTVRPVVHGGLGPHSLWVRLDGQVQLADAGLALAMARVAAPEVVPEVAGDVQMVGALLFWALTGQTPPANRTEALDLRVAAPDVPSSLANVVRRSTSPAASQRHTHAMVLGLAMESAFKQAGGVATHRDVSAWLLSLFPGGHPLMESYREALTPLGAAGDLPSRGTTPPGTGPEGDALLFVLKPPAQAPAAAPPSSQAPPDEAESPLPMAPGPAASAPWSPPPPEAPLPASAPPAAPAHASPPPPASLEPEGGMASPEGWDFVPTDVQEMGGERAWDGMASPGTPASAVGPSLGPPLGFEPTLDMSQPDAPAHQPPTTDPATTGQNAPGQNAPWLEPGTMDELELSPVPLDTLEPLGEPVASVPSVGPPWVQADLPPAPGVPVSQEPPPPAPEAPLTQEPPPPAPEALVTQEPPPAATEPLAQPDIPGQAPAPDQPQPSAGQPQAPATAMKTPHGRSRLPLVLGGVGLVAVAAAAWLVWLAPPATGDAVPEPPAADLPGSAVAVAEPRTQQPSVVPPSDPAPATMPAEGQGTPEPHPEDPPASQGAPPEAAPQEPEKPEETDKATEEPAPVKLSPAERRRQEAAERKAALAAAKAAKREAAKAKAEAKKAALAEAKAAKKGAKTKTQRGDVAKPDEGATGTLTLKIRPWANVWVNKKKVGTTPLPPLSLKAGKHTVKLVNDELKVTRTQTVVVEAGKNVDLKMNLGD